MKNSESPAKRLKIKEEEIKNFDEPLTKRLKIKEEEIKNSDEPPAKQLKKKRKRTLASKRMFSSPKRTVMRVFSSMRTFSMKKKRRRKRRKRMVMTRKDFFIYISYIRLPFPF